MKVMRLALITILVTSISCMAFADSNIAPARKGMGSGKSDLGVAAGKRIERGVNNALLGWAEIPKSVVDTTRESKNPIWGLTGGVLKGIAKAFPKTVSGLFDVATSPIASEAPDISTEPLE